MMGELSLLEARAVRFMSLFINALMLGEKEEQLRYAKLVKSELKYLIRDYEEEEK